MEAEAGWERWPRGEDAELDVESLFVQAKPLPGFSGKGPVRPEFDREAPRIGFSPGPVERRAVHGVGRGTERERVGASAEEEAPVPDSARIGGHWVRTPSERVLTWPTEEIEAIYL